MGDLEPAILAIVTKIPTSVGDATAANQVTIIADVGTVDGVVDGIQTDLSNATDGLGALKTLIDAVNTDLGDFSAQANLQSLLASLGVPDVAGKPLYTCLVTDRLDHATYGLSSIRNHLAEVQDIVIYPAAEDRATAELDRDGLSPNYLAESSQSNIDESAGMASPAWTEDIDLEQDGTTTVISIYANLRWAQKQTGGGTSSAKIQISGDGGSTWVDLTNNVTETGTSYADKTRAGVGRWLTAITSGANQLQLRLCQWGGTTSSQVKLREDSYLRITYRKG